MPRSLLQVPKREVGPLSRLLSLSPERYEALDRALRESEAGFSIASLSALVAEKSGLARDEVNDLVRVLSMLYRVRDREQSGTEEFLSEVERAAKDADKDAFATIDWSVARTRLEKLLSHAKSLGVTAKVLDVLTEHDRVFCDARVLTDVRPVFAADVDTSPDALLVVHELRISYHRSERGGIEAAYIAMDASDLQTLRDVLDRAAKKEATMEALAAKSGVPVLKARSHGG